MHPFCLAMPYGLLMICGGAVGFLVSGSKASLVAGGGSGGILTLLGYGMYTEYKAKNNVSWPWSLASLAHSLLYIAALLAVVSGTVTVLMGKRLKETGKIMPSGVIAALSLGMSLFYCHHVVKGITKTSGKKAP